MAQSAMESTTPLTRVDLTIKDNRDQAVFELRRALDTADDAKLVVWARTWGESAMRALMKPLTISQ